MLIVHLFLAILTLICVTLSLPPGVRGWLRLLLVALPGFFFLPFCLLKGNGSAFRFYRIFVELASNQDMHKVSEEFEFRPDRIIPFGVSCS